MARHKRVTETNAGMPLVIICLVYALLAAATAVACWMLQSGGWSDWIRIAASVSFACLSVGFGVLAFRTWYAAHST